MREMPTTCILYTNGIKRKSENIDDGFSLINTYITAAVKCAPPQNKPLRQELGNCSSYLKDEISILNNVKIIICLGRIAFESCCKLFNVKDKKFSHGKMFNHKKFTIICSYHHPSRQNTQTERLLFQHIMKKKLFPVSLKSFYMK